MGEQKPTGPRSVAISFAAFDGDPYPRVRQTGHYLQGPSTDPMQWGPTLRAIGDPRSALFARVSDWYYLCHPVKGWAERVAGHTAAEVGEDTRRAIAEHVPQEVRPRFHVVTWKTDAPPNDHGDLWRDVQRELHRVREAHPDAEIVIMLGTGTDAMHAVLFLAGSVGLVDGPLRLVQVERGEGARLRPHKLIAEVTLTIETVLKIARQTVAVHPGGNDPGIWYEEARSPALRRAREEAREAARLPFPVLLRGERGVGKSSLAVLIRAWSPYRQRARDREWPAIACGQFPDPQLLMAELCGSVRGAFTSVDTRPGLLMLAHEDTLFLDEIHDMSEANQRVIIRLLEDGKYRPVGSNELRTSKFRLITGTNQSNAVLAERLSPDFLDRIRDIEIRVPPLRECPEDLPWMWAAAWGDVARRSGLSPSALDPHLGDIVGALARDPLPGNWRDLRRLAVRFAMRLDARTSLTEREVKGVLTDVFAATGVLAAPEAGVPVLPLRQAEQLRKLEGELGPGLTHLWAACADGTSARIALQRLLGDRHRASRAEKFITKVFPDRFAGLALRARSAR